MGAVELGLVFYALPILIGPDSPSSSSVQAISQQAIYTGEFTKDRQDSVFLHWGEGIVSVSRKRDCVWRRTAPGPDYKVYLSPKFIETEQAFNDNTSELLKSEMSKHLTGCSWTTRKGYLILIDLIPLWFGVRNFWPIYYFCQDKMIALP